MKTYRVVQWATGNIGTRALSTRCRSCARPPGHRTTGDLPQVIATLG